MNIRLPHLSLFQVIPQSFPIDHYGILSVQQEQTAFMRRDLYDKMSLPQRLPFSIRKMKQIPAGIQPKFLHTVASLQRLLRLIQHEHQSSV